MAHILTIENDVVSLDLAMDTDAGYHFVSYIPPRPNRQLARISGFPFANGDSTRASSLGDVAADFVVTIVGTSADDLDARFQTLIKLLEAAQRWEEQHIGSPVRLRLARQGVTNSSYRVVTGVPAMPQPLDAETINWFDLSSIAGEMTVAFTLTLAPVAHAATLTTIAEEEIIGDPGSNVITTSAVGGDMPSPVVLVISNTSPVNWTEMWIAQLAADPILYNWTFTADVGSLGGMRAATLGPAEQHLGTFPWAPTVVAPLRGLIRIAVTSGDATQVRLRFKIYTGAGGQYVAGPWISPAFQITNYGLFDLGTLRIPTSFINRPNQSQESVVTFAVGGLSADGTAVGVKTDYIEVLPYRGFVRLIGDIIHDNVMNYGMAERNYDGSLYWPSVHHDAYVTNPSALLAEAVSRYGALEPVHPGEPAVFWFAPFMQPGHALDMPMSVTILQLKTFALGLRGAL